MTNWKSLLKPCEALRSAVAALLTTIAVWTQLSLSSHEPLQLVLLFALYVLFRKAVAVKDRSVFIGALLCGGLFAAFTVFGTLDLCQDRLRPALWLLLRFLGLFFLYSALLRLLFSRLKSCSLLLPESEERDLSVKARLRVFLLYWLLLSVGFFFWWLYQYPGNTSPDSNNQLLQALGLMPLSDHHPAVHTFLLGAIFRLGMSCFGGNQNAALALYTFLQFITMAAAFAFLAETLYEARVKKGVIALVLLAYLLVPHHGSYSVTVWKDVLFSAFVTILCVCIWRILFRYEKDRSLSLFDATLLLISSVGTCLFRSNGLYAFLLFAPCFFVYFIRKNRIIALLPVVSLLLALLVKGPVYKTLDITPPDTIEALSLPAQHIARVIRDGHTLSEEQRAMLEKVVDVDAVAEAYHPGISDPIKALVRSTGDQDYLAAHGMDYARLWLSLGLRYPGAYLRAQIDQTKGYWYPDVSYWSMSNHCESSDVLNIHKDRQLPSWWVEANDALYFYLPTLPLAGLLFSIGSAVWMLLALLTLCLIKGRAKLLLVFLPVLTIVFMLCLITPVFAEYRYAYCLFTTLPLLTVLPFCDPGEQSASVSTKTKE